MAANAEFRIIDILARRCGVAPAAAGVELGIGDDAALCRVPGGEELVTATDMLVAGTHFLPNAPAASVGHRALAVNLSDLAAMGAAPKWATLALALPAADESWVSGFADGFAALAQQFNLALIGGDTVRGPLSVTVTAMGVVPDGTAVRRCGARPGDGIYVTGEPGRAAAGRPESERMSDDPVAGFADNRRCFEYPQPRVAAGQRLRAIVTAMIDVSDGVATDLARLLSASDCGGECNVAGIDALAEQVGVERATDLFLNGGEDYELCFTAPPDADDRIQAVADELDLTITRLGQVVSEPGLRWCRDGRELPVTGAPFSHFGRTFA